MIALIAEGYTHTMAARGVIRVRIYTFCYRFLSRHSLLSFGACGDECDTQNGRKTAHVDNFRRRLTTVVPRFTHWFPGPGTGLFLRKEPLFRSTAAH